MSEMATVRVARSLDLIPYVLEHQGVTVEELSQVFNCDKKVLLKDLEMLFMCGLPGYTHTELLDISFEDGYVAIKDPQNLDRPRKLSKAEATMIVVALNAMLGLLNEQSKDGARSSLKESIILILEKIISMLKLENVISFQPNYSKEFSESVAQDVQTSKSKNESSLKHLSKDKDSEPSLDQSENSIEYWNDLIQKQLVIKIKYTSLAGIVSERFILPTKINLVNSKFYVRATDLILQAERTFTLARISIMETLSRSHYETNLRLKAELDKVEHSTLREVNTHSQVKLRLRGKKLAFDIENPMLDCIETIEPVTKKNSKKASSSNRVIIIEKVQTQWLIAQIIAANGQIDVLEPKELKTELEQAVSFLQEKYG